MIKILLVGLQRIDKIELAKKLTSKNDDLSIAPIFTTNAEYKNTEINENFIYYMDTLTVNLSFKNNSFLYINTIDYVSHGITIDDYYNNDIICMSIEEFNSISPKTFEHDELLIIWIDEKGKVSNNELTEVKYFQDELSKYNYMYFLNEDMNDISDIILDYLSCNDEQHRNELLNENN